MPPDLTERHDHRRENQSGIPDEGLVVESPQGGSIALTKVAQPVADHHHEDGHECGCDNDIVNRQVQ